MEQVAIDRTALLEKVIADFPKLHHNNGEPVFWGVSSEVMRLFASLLEPGMKTIETGAGFSSLCFIVAGTEHTAIAPDDYLEANIRGFCDERDIDHSQFTYVNALSQDALPTMQSKFDFAFIDGDHGFPVAILDYYFMGKLLRPGGIMAVDDTHLWTGDIITKFMMTDTQWEFLSESGKTTLFRLKSPFVAKSWGAQPFLIANSRSIKPHFFEGLRR